MILAMIVGFRHLVGCLVSTFRSRQDLILENLSLRQQLLALHAQRPRRRLTAPQKLFWVLLRRVWASWKQPLIPGCTQEAVSRVPGTTTGSDERYRVPETCQTPTG